MIETFLALDIVVFIHVSLEHAYDGQHVIYSHKGIVYNLRAVVRCGHPDPVQSKTK